MWRPGEAVVARGRVELNINFPTPPPIGPLSLIFFKNMWRSGKGGGLSPWFLH